MSEGPFAPHLKAFDEKIRAEDEVEVTIKMKGKHLKAIRRSVNAHLYLLTRRPLPNDKPEDVEVLRQADKILYEACQIQL